MDVPDLYRTPSNFDTRVEREVDEAQAILVAWHPLLAIIDMDAGGEMEIDIVNRHIRAGISQAKLTGLEQSLFYLLATNAGETETREEILDALCGADFAAESNIIDRQIRKLRVKLQNSWHTSRFVATVHGQCYRFGQGSRTSHWLKFRHPDTVGNASARAKVGRLLSAIGGCSVASDYCQILGLGRRLPELTTSARGATIRWVGWDNRARLSREVTTPKGNNRIRPKVLKALVEVSTTLDDGLAKHLRRFVPRDQSTMLASWPLVPGRLDRWRAPPFRSVLTSCQEP
jgi:DNA-binding winged helix-turn-helix (wHTH) protein